jgi:KDO2-lipid IV(A) lauroyltransferase
MEFICICIARGLRLLPHRLIIIGSRLLSWLLQHLFRFRSAIIRQQLQDRLGYLASDPSLGTQINKVYNHFGMLIFELLQLPRMPSTQLKNIIILHHDSHLDTALKRSRGVIILSAHLGNWEYCGLGLAGKGYKINAVGKSMKSTIGNILLRLIRDDHGVHTIPKNDSTREIFKCLKNNEIIAFLLDQNMTFKEGVFVDFFGRLASTSPGLAVIAARTGAAIIPAFSFRDNDNLHHHLVFQPEFELENPLPTPQSNSVHNTARLTKIIETAIRDHPDQWLWMHKRWRTRPRPADATP